MNHFKFRLNAAGIQHSAIKVFVQFPSVDWKKTLMAFSAANS